MLAGLVQRFHRVGAQPVRSDWDAEKSPIRTWHNADADCSVALQRQLQIGIWHTT